jgi:hypothetical protein
MFKEYLVSGLILLVIFSFLLWIGMNLNLPPYDGWGFKKSVLWGLDLINNHNDAAVLIVITIEALFILIYAQGCGPGFIEKPYKRAPKLQKFAWLTFKLPGIFIIATSLIMVIFILFCLIKDKDYFQTSEHNTQLQQSAVNVCTRLNGCVNAIYEPDSLFKRFVFFRKEGNSLAGEGLSEEAKVQKVLIDELDSQGFWFRILTPVRPVVEIKNAAADLPVGITKGRRRKV